MNINLLKNIPLFSSLDNDSLSELAGYLEKHTYPPFHTIFWMNERGENLYIIQSGRVAISYTDEQGREIELNTLRPGSFFGELSLIDGGPHTATARTIGETVLLTLDRATFYHFLHKHSDLAYTLLEVLSLRLRNSTERMRQVVNVNEQLEAKSSPFQHFIDRLAKALTSSLFVTLYILFIIGWIIAQVLYYKATQHLPISFLDRPPTFYILGFLITLTSFVLTVLILNSQRRQAEHDRIRGEIEYQVNVKSQTEVMKLQLKMDELIQMVSRHSNEPPPTSDQEVPNDF